MTFRRCLLNQTRILVSLGRFLIRHVINQNQNISQYNIKKKVHNISYCRHTTKQHTDPHTHYLYQDRVSSFPTLTLPSKIVFHTFKSGVLFSLPAALCGSHVSISLISPEQSHLAVEHYNRPVQTLSAIFTFYTIVHSANISPMFVLMS